MRRRLLALAVLTGMHALAACMSADGGDPASARTDSVIAQDRVVRYDAMFREAGHCVTLTTDEGAWRSAPLFPSALPSLACSFEWNGAGAPSAEARAELERRVAADHGLVKESSNLPPATVPVFIDAPAIDGGLTPTHGCDVCIDDDGAVTYLSGEEVYGFLAHDVLGEAEVRVQRSDGATVRFTLLGPSAGPFTAKLPPAPIGVHYIDGPLTLRN